MGVDSRLRDSFVDRIPVWLRSGVAYKVLWAIHALYDAELEVGLQAGLAAMPGVGTPTALPMIGRSRGLLRGQADTNEEFADRLCAWLDTWREAGSAEGLAKRIHEYLYDRPRVRVVGRHGLWTTVNADGTIERHTQAWDWDSVSHPERANDWWDIFIIVDRPTEWIHRVVDEVADLTGDDGYGLGHLATHEEYDAVRSLISDWMSFHSNVRAVIWSGDPTLFDPENPASLPDGTYGAWGTTGDGSRVLSNRPYDDCRFWEPGSD